MWVALVFGYAAFKILKGFLFGPSEDNSLHHNESKIKISVAKKLEKVYNGKAFIGMRIPDASTGTRQNIDILLLTERELYVISVGNFEGTLDSKKESDECWSWTDVKGYTQKIPDLVSVTKNKATVLESYLEIRGLKLPPGFLSVKVVLVDRKLRLMSSIALQPEVLTYDKWAHLHVEETGYVKKLLKNMFSGMEHDALKDFSRQLRFILSTSPSWDRVELKGNHVIFGEFLGFKGKKEDVDSLVDVKRSKVSKIFAHKSTMFDFLVPVPKVQLVCVGRDYRRDNDFAPEIKEINVRSDTEVSFRLIDSQKIQQFRTQRLVGMVLSS